MSKYKPYVSSANELIMHAKVKNFVVYKNDRTGRYYLVLSGKEVAWKNVVDDDDVDFDKWIKQWQKNIRKRYKTIESQIVALGTEKAEIFDIICGE